MQRETGYSVKIPDTCQNLPFDINRQEVEHICVAASLEIPIFFSN